MKHVPQDKYNVAWFTLAECVARGEKVRALGVYRLLSHSIDDIAFRRQLEGDILLAFQDTASAIIRYQDAALLYRKGNKLLEAIAVYEHLRSLDPFNHQYLDFLLELYSKVHIPSKIIAMLRLIFEVRLRQQDFVAAGDILTKMEELGAIDQILREYQQYIFEAIRHTEFEPAFILLHIKKVVQGLLVRDDTLVLQQFFAMLDALDSEYGQQARSFVGGQ